MSIASCRLRRLIAWLLMVALLSGCASSKLHEPPPTPSVVRPPPPPAELMTPIESSPVNVQQLLQRWTELTEAWLRKREACKATPTSCA